MKVHVPTPLQSYTAGQHTIAAGGTTIGETLAEIERRFPGFRFRIIDEQNAIRPHIKIFVNAELARDLKAATQPEDAIHIICALSGG